MIRYRFRLWRARHLVWIAEQNYRRFPSPRNASALQRAGRYLTWLEVGGP